MAITGRDTILESSTQDGITELLTLGFGGCKLQIQVPEKGPIQSVDQLAGKRVVTSYTTLAKSYFHDVDVRLGLISKAESGEYTGQGTHIEYVGGSVEAACALGLADGIGKSPFQWHLNPADPLSLKSTSSNQEKRCAQQACTLLLPSWKPKPFSSSPPK